MNNYIGVEFSRGGRACGRCANPIVSEDTWDYLFSEGAGLAAEKFHFLEDFVVFWEEEAGVKVLSASSLCAPGSLQPFHTKVKRLLIENKGLVSIELLGRVDQLVMQEMFNIWEPPVVSERRSIPSGQQDFGFARGNLLAEFGDFDPDPQVPVRTTRPLTTQAPVQGAQRTPSPLTSQTGTPQTTTQASRTSPTPKTPHLLHTPSSPGPDLARLLVREKLYFHTRLTKIEKKQLLGKLSAEGLRGGKVYSLVLSGDAWRNEGVVRKPSPELEGCRKIQSGLSVSFEAPQGGGLALMEYGVKGSLLTRGAMPVILAFNLQASNLDVKATLSPKLLPALRGFSVQLNTSSEMTDTGVISSLPGTPNGRSFTVQLNPTLVRESLTLSLQLKDPLNKPESLFCVCSFAGGLLDSAAAKLEPPRPRPEVPTDKVLEVDYAIFFQ